MSDLTNNEREELLRLRAMINNPQIADYLEAVKNEAIHQRERWGSDHDANKEDTDWIFLIGFLLGKSAAAFRAGNQEKGMHHIISAGAAGFNWHLQVIGLKDGVRPGLNPEKVPQ